MLDHLLLGLSSLSSGLVFFFFFGGFMVVELGVVVVVRVCGWGFKQQFGYVLVAGGCDLGLGFWVFVFIWV